MRLSDGRNWLDSLAGSFSYNVVISRTELDWIQSSNSQIDTSKREPERITQSYVLILDTNCKCCQLNTSRMPPAVDASNMDASSGGCRQLWMPPLVLRHQLWMLPVCNVGQ
jgi:hypothetical protein